MTKTLLLADDSITIQKVVGITFANEEYKIVSVDNGEDAVLKAGAIKPDIILADVVMPKLDGYQVCERVKADPGLKHIPILLLTGAFKPFDENRSKQVGADGHIAKPFDSQTLIDKVKDLVAKAADKPKSAPAPMAPAPPPPPPVAAAQPAPAFGASSGGDPFATPSEKSSTPTFSPPPAAPTPPYAAPKPSAPSAPSRSGGDSWGSMENTSPGFPAPPSTQDTVPSPMELSMFEGLGAPSPSPEKSAPEAPENIWDVPPPSPTASFPMASPPNFSSPFGTPAPAAPAPNFSSPPPPPFFSPPPPPAAPTFQPPPPPQQPPASGLPTFGSFIPSAPSAPQSIEPKTDFPASSFDFSSPEPLPAAPSLPDDTEPSPFEPMPIGGFTDTFPATPSFSLDSFSGSPAPEMPVEESAPISVQPPSPIKEARPSPSSSAVPSTSSDPMSNMTREVIEKICWEIIPDLAESIIREEIERLKREKGVFK